MNRILTVPDSQSDRSSSGEQLTLNVSDAPSCGLFAPVNYERNYAYPLIVWLHDAGGDERQLPGLMPHISLRNFVAAAPRGILPCLGDGVGQQRGAVRGWTWCERPGSERPDEVQAARESVESCIADACRCYRIHPQRIFLAGQGMGGTLALRLSLLDRCRFAGAASLLGAFPRGNQPLRCLETARQLPLLLAVGSNSKNYPIAELCEDLRLFHSAGMQVQVRQYPVEDDLTTVMLDDLNRWIMQQVCPPAVIEECRRAAHRASSN